MKQYDLHVSPRKELGRGPAGRMRKAGKLPAVLYNAKSGTGAAQGEPADNVRHLTIETREFRDLHKKMAGTTALIQIIEEGKDNCFAVIQDLQRDPLADTFIHIDFREIERGKPMHAPVIIHTVGEAFGVRNQAGVIEVSAYQVEVRCLPRHLPEYIEIDVTELRTGQSYSIADLVAPEGVEFLDDPDTTVVACVGATPDEPEPSDDDEDEITEPELIGRGKSDDEEEGGSDDED